ncbi:hypothetical protein Cgig2_006019 [Carnegiea gigantea]|uniref:SURP motif domain-containing protein n=1 Tax=Carnegiea gigantea TaxID=171969 RepID=A0A9Q1L0E2_9CARY|nr:hypothetical protein Cgig2_006019 [Carnegiea gigantea]
MDSDEEDFVFVGTPIEREEEINSRKKKALAETSGHLRTLPAWKQEVRDEEGRRRFHGAFTGGFSAGFYNTVGSKEGWTPQSFSSSWKSRAEVKKQSVLDFLDEDEKAEMEGHLLGTSSQFDTFGFTAAELARKRAEKEQKQRPSAIPGPVPDELVAPATESVGLFSDTANVFSKQILHYYLEHASCHLLGVKLLLKMGWRRGRSIKDSGSNSVHGTLLNPFLKFDVRREARKAFLALSSSDKPDGSEPVVSGPDDLIEEPATDGVQSSQCLPVYVRQPKQDLYGLGYDPYKHAPEFREMKRSCSSENKEIVIRKPFSSKHGPVASKSRRLAPGFGIGALEELDVEDEDIYASGYDYAETYVLDDKEPSGTLEDCQKRAGKDLGFVPRFKIASNSGYQLERFEPPIVPSDFVARHKFPALLDTNNLTSSQSPPEVPPPEDNNLKVMIEGVAALVARCGKLFEDISKEKNKSNPLFDFLNGGRGHDYYARKLWEAQQKHTDQIKWRPDEKLYCTVQKMTAESRGKILGERPLERSLKDSSSSASVEDHVHIQSNMSDTFTKPERELLETAKPFKDDPAKQERFEQFLKDKYQGGLRTTDSGKASNMTEAARARERLDFEAAAEAIEKAKSANQSKLSAQQFMEFTMAAGPRFTSGGVEHGKASSTEEVISKKVYPKREEFQWRPAPLLCKRFDIVDPFMGKPPPAPRARSKLDLMFTSDAAKITKSEDIIVSNDLLHIPSKSNENVVTEMEGKESEVAVEVENVERPVDLYKAIFSDDSDDEVEEAGVNQTEDPQKKTEAASAALSRLVASDFLESLGKELGLEVPPDVPPPTTKTGTSPSIRHVPEDSRATGAIPQDLPPSASLDNHGQPTIQGHIESKPLEHTVGNEDIDREKSPSSRKKNDNDVRPDTEDRRDRMAKYDRSSSSSEDGRSRKRFRRHRHRHSSSESDSSNSSEDRYRSRSRDHKRRSSRKKHRRRKHSKHK